MKVKTSLSGFCPTSALHLQGGLEEAAEGTRKHLPPFSHPAEVRMRRNRIGIPSRRVALLVYTVDLELGLQGLDIQLLAEPRDVYLGKLGRYSCLWMRWHIRWCFQLCSACTCENLNPISGILTNTSHQAQLVGNVKLPGWATRFRGSRLKKGAFKPLFLMW